MPGDWIKMEHDLPDKPEVIALASLLSMDRFAVVGRLLRLWVWFDRHSKDGCASGVTTSFLDTLVSHDGFAAAMFSVGWLKDRNGRISVPNFDRHISKSAKRRALGAERMKRSRDVPSATEPSPEREGESVTVTKSLKAQALDAGTLEKIDWKEVSNECREVCQSVKPQKPEDRALVIKAVVLSKIVFDRDWLWVAVKKAKRKQPRDQFRYLHGSLKGQCRDCGQEFNALLRQIEVPEELMRPPEKATA